MLLGAVFWCLIRSVKHGAYLCRDAGIVVDMLKYTYGTSTRYRACSRSPLLDPQKPGRFAEGASDRDRLDPKGMFGDIPGSSSQPGLREEAEFRHTDQVPKKNDITLGNKACYISADFIKAASVAYRCPEHSKQRLVVSVILACEVGIVALVLWDDPACAF